MGDDNNNKEKYPILCLFMMKRKGYWFPFLHRDIKYCKIRKHCVLN